MTGAARQCLLILFINSRPVPAKRQRLLNEALDAQFFTGNQLLHVKKRFRIAAPLRPVGFRKYCFITIAGEYAFIIGLTGDLTAMHSDRLFFQVHHAGNINRL